MQTSHAYRTASRMLILLGCLVLAFNHLAYAQSLSGSRPNVIFVMPDDISHNAFSYFNANGPRTPNIDRLAENSVRLTDFHVSPTCIKITDTTANRSKPILDKIELSFGK